MNYPKVSILILNWNGWKDTIECLESVYQIDYPNYDVILVDNDSSDDSIEKIKEYCKGKIKVKSDFFKYKTKNKPIKIIEYSKDDLEFIEESKGDATILPPNRKLVLIKNDKNYGFAEGNNIGITFTLNNLDSDYILLLNNDTVVSNDFLDKLIESIETKNKIGIVGSNIFYYSEKVKIQTNGWNIDWKRGKEHLPERQSNNLLDVDFIGGCSLLFKSEVAKKIGFLDPQYFAYWEDADFCLRAKKAGYRAVCNPDSKIWHKGSASSKKITCFNVYYYTRNRFLFMKKYSTKKQYTLFKLYFFLYEFWLSTTYFVINKKLSEFSSYYSGIKDGLENKDIIIE